MRFRVEGEEKWGKRGYKEIINRVDLRIWEGKYNTDYDEVYVEVTKLPSDGTDEVVYRVKGRPLGSEERSSGFGRRDHDMHTISVDEDAAGDKESIAEVVWNRLEPEKEEVMEV